MFVRQLHYLVALSREQHFTRAAESCHVSQPALSGAIRNLEEELGVVIVRRGHNFLGFTPEGERILLRAQQIIADWDALRQDIATSEDQLRGTLRIGAIPTTQPMVAMLTAHSLRHFPAVKYQVQSLSSEQLIRRMDAFELDIALTDLGDDTLSGFRILPLYQEHYVLLTRNQTELAQAAELPWSALDGLPLCLLSPHMQNRRIIDAALRRAGVQPNLRVETDSILSLYSHIYHADLYSVVPHSMLSFSDFHEQLTAIPLTPKLSRDIGLITPDRDPCSPLINASWSLFQSIDLQLQLDARIIPRFS